MHNCNSEFILYFIQRQKDGRFQSALVLGIGLEFERNNIYAGNNFSEGPPDPKRDAQVIRVQFDIVFSLSNKRKVFFRNIYFGTALKSGPVETVPTGLVATALHHAGFMHFTYL